MDKSRTKSLNRKKPFYYHDIINYINNHNKHITKTKIKIRTIYQKIIQEGSKQHTITGEIKKQVPDIQFEQIWKNTFQSYRQPFMKGLHYKLLTITLFN